MFEGLVERLLSKVLGQYIENFSAQNLKIGIWSGEVILSNIALKKTVLGKLNLPFKINYSRLGSLKMNIPWKSLTSSKIEVCLEGLELIVSDIPIADWQCKDIKIIEKRQKEIQSLCESILEDFARKGEKAKQKNEDGYFSKLVVKVIDNLQVTIRDIHIRYEDENSKLFSFGFTLEQFKLYTVNAKGEPQYIDRSKPENEGQPLRKRLELTNVGVYWNESSEFFNETNFQAKMSGTIARRGQASPTHNYLFLMTSQAQLLQRQPGKQFAQPQIDLKIQLEDISTHITKTQLQQIIVLAQRLQRYSRKLKEENSVKLTVEQSAANRNYFKQIFPRYYDGWGKNLRPEEMERVQGILQKMQVQAFIKDINQFLQEKQKERIIKEQMEKNRSWWFGKPKELTADQLSQIEAYLNTNFGQEISIIRRPQDYYYVRVVFTLKKLQLSIANTTSIFKEGIKTVMEQLLIDFSLREGGYGLDISLQDISVSIFKQIGVQPIEYKSVLYKLHQRSSKEEDAYLRLKVVGCPLDKKHLNTDIKLVTSELLLAFDPKIISIATQFANLQLSSQNKETAIQKFGEIKQATSNAVSESIQKPKKIKIGIDVTINSMTVLLPFSPHRQESDCWGLSLGSVRISSDEETLMRSQADSELPLDVFNLEMTSFSFRHYASPSQLTNMLLTNSPYPTPTNAILDKLDLFLRVEMFASATDTRPKLRVQASLAGVQVQLNEFTYKSVLKVGEAFEMEQRVQSGRMTARIQEKKQIQKRSSKIGFVYIKSTITKIWQKYVAIMSENYIYLYLNKNDKDYYAYYYIKGANLIKTHDPQDKEKPYHLTIKNKVNQVVFGFDKQQQTEDWVIKINALSKVQQIAELAMNTAVVNILGGLLIQKNHNQLNFQLDAQIQTLGIKVYTTQSQKEGVVQLAFKGLATRVFLHQSKKIVQLRLKSIQLTDTLSKYKNKDLIFFLQTKLTENQEDLIIISVEQLNKDHPQYDLTDSSIDVTFGTLVCNYKCETVKALMSFFLPPSAPQQPHKDSQSTQMDVTSSTLSMGSENSSQSEHYTLKLNVKIQEISVTLVNKKTKTLMGRLGINGLGLYMGISQKRTVLTGSLKDLFLIDTTNYPHTIYEQQQQYPSNRYLLTANIGSDKNMLQFNIQLLKSLNQYRKNLLIDVRLANLTTYFSLQPVLRIITYLNTQMLPSLQTAPNNLEQQPAPLPKDTKPEPGTMDLRVELSNISVFIQTEKVKDKQKQQFLQLNIAAITVGSESVYRGYTKEKRAIVLVESYHVSLYALSMAVHYFDVDGAQHRYKLTNNMDLSLTTDLIANPEYYKKEIPDDFQNGMRVDCKMTPFSMCINHHDYSFIMKCLNWGVSHNDGLDIDLFDPPSQQQQQPQAQQPPKDPFYLTLTMECLSLFITQDSVPIAFLQQPNLRVDLGMIADEMQLKVSIEQLYGTSIEHNKQTQTLRERGIFNSLGYSALHKVGQIHDMESYLKLFQRRQRPSQSKDFLSLVLSMTPRALSLDIIISQIAIDVDVRLLLILSTLANADPQYILGPSPIKTQIKPIQVEGGKIVNIGKQMKISMVLGKLVGCVSDSAKQKFVMVQGEISCSITLDGDKNINELEESLRNGQHEGHIPHSTINAALKDLTLYFSKIRQGKRVGKRQFLQPMTLQVQMKRFYHMQQQIHMLSTDIRLRMSELALSTSLRDMLNVNLIIQDNLAVLPKAPQQQQPNQKNKQQIGRQNIQEELEKIESKITKEIQTKTKVMGEVGPMQIQIINDCGRNFMPVVRLLVEGTEPGLQQTIISTEVFVVPIFSLYFFNQRSSRWQPIIQPFKASFNLTTVTLNRQQTVSMTLKTGPVGEETSCLRLNVSTQMLSTLLAAKEVLLAEKNSIDSKKEEPQEDIEVSPFLFHNLTNQKIFIIRGEGADQEFVLPPLFKGPVKLPKEGQRLRKEHMSNERERASEGRERMSEGKQRISSESQLVFRVGDRKAIFGMDHYGVLRIPETPYFIKFDTEKLNKVITFMPQLIVRNRLRQPVWVRRIGASLNEAPLQLDRKEALPLDGADSFAVSINGHSFTEGLGVSSVKLTGFMIAEKKNFVVLLRYKERAGKPSVVELLPPFVVYNCLPKPVTLQFLQRAKLKSTVTVAAQQSHSIFTAEDVRSLQVKATVGGFTWSKKFKYHQEQIQGRLQLGDQDCHSSLLSYRFTREASSQFLLTLYTPKFIVSQLKDKLIVFGNRAVDEREKRREDFHMLGGQRKNDDTFDEKIVLIGDEVGNRLRVCGAHSQLDFATPIAVGGLGSSQARIVVEREEGGRRLSLFTVVGVQISAVRMSKHCDIFSKKIVLRSKAIFVNNTKRRISLRQEAVTSYSFHSEAGSKQPLVFALPEIPSQQPRFVFSSEGFQPSRPISLPTQGSLYFRLPSQEGEGPVFRVVVKQAEGYRFYQVAEVSAEEYPYELVVRAAGMRARVGTRTVQAGQAWRFIKEGVEDGDWVQLIISHAESQEEVTVRLSPDNLQFKRRELLKIVKGGLEGSLGVSVEVTLRDKQRAIVVDELARAQLPQELQQKAISVQLGEIVVSMVQNSQAVQAPYESLVVTLKRLQLIMLETDRKVHYQAKLGFLQIDQAYPHVLASPVILTPYRFLQFTREEEPKAIFNSTIVFSKQFVRNTFISQITLEINDLVATFSADFLALAATMATEFGEVANYKEESYLLERVEEGWKNVQLPVEGRAVFVRCIKIAPFVVDLSAELNLKKLNLQNNLLISTVLSTVGVVVSNIDSAPISMTGIEIDDCIDTVDSISGRLIAHYKGVCVGQLYKVVGSLNIIGNPLSLFRNISTGVKDLTDKPAKGFVNGPAQFGMGIVEGTTSLVAHSVGGAFNSIAKVTGTVSTGLATLAFDQQFQQHREKQRMKKPQNVIQGVAKGGKAIFYGFKQGITGVFTQPVENARKEGALGFVKGAAKGLAGLVVKPVTGIIDFASKTTEGIKNNALMFQDRPREDRMRHPRVLYSECFILKQYNPRDSLLFAILKKVDSEGRCPNPVFVDAFQADDGRHFLILLLSGVAFLDAESRKLKWAIDFSQMQLQESGKKLVFRKGGKSGTLFQNYELQIENNEVRGIVAQVILALQKERRARQ